MARAALLVAALLAAPVAAGCLDDIFGDERVHTATAILRSDPFPDLVVEVDHVEGYPPGAEALAILEQTLGDIVDKRTLTIDGPAAVAGRLPEAPTTQDLYAFHARHLDTALDEDTVVIHVMYVNGRWQETPNAIGMASPRGQASPVFMFADNLQGLYNGSLPNPTWRNVERATLVHEVGHLMGLVNFGAPMLTDRAHPESPQHSRYETSVMYPAAKTYLSALELVQENAHIPYKFDEHDLADLRALRDGVTQPQRFDDR